jgi:hypothetical protein
MRNVTMKKNLSIFCALVGLLFAQPLAAQPFDGSKALLCAAMEANQCAPAGGCASGSAEAINFPEFFRVDFDAKAITSTRSEGTKRTTPIEAMSRSGAGTLLHGAQAEFAWSMVISAEGKMTLTVSGDRQGFIVFGACTVP